MWYGIPDLSSLTRHQTCTPYSGREAITAGPPMELLKLNLDEEWWRWWWHNKTEVFIPKSHIFITWTNRKLYEGKRCLLVRRKTMTNLDSVLKSKDIILLTKFYIVKAMVFPVVMYRYKSWILKKAECPRIDAFELWCWRRLENPLESKEIKSVNPKGNKPWICQSLWLCGSQQTVENSERDGNTIPPDQPLEKSVCRSGSNS